MFIEFVEHGFRRITNSVHAIDKKWMITDYDVARSEVLCKKLKELREMKKLWSNEDSEEESY